MSLVRKSVLASLVIAAYFFAMPLLWAQALWGKWALHQEISLTSCFTMQAFANVLSTVDETLKVFFPDASSIDKEKHTLSPQDQEAIEAAGKVRLDRDEFQFYVAKKEGEILGYAIQDAVPGKWGLIYYMLHIDPQGKIKDTIVLAYEEKRGKPVAKRRFLKQFRGKTVKNKIKMMSDIRGVTGASISSRGMTDGIRKTLHVFNRLYGAK